MPPPNKPRPGQAAQANDGFFRVLEHQRLTGQPEPRHPELEKIVGTHKGVQKDLRKLWWDSDPYADFEQRRKMGLFVRRNARGDIWTEPYSRPGRRGENKVEADSRDTAAGKVRDVLDWLLGNQTIATAHSHVGNPLRHPDRPSNEDYAATKATGVPGIIVGHDGQYYYGSPGLPPLPVPGWQFWK